MSKLITSQPLPKLNSCSFLLMCMPYQKRAKRKEKREMVWNELAHPLPNQIRGLRCDSSSQFQHDTTFAMLEII